jgi:predicted metal-dependent phosphoesterase TrpH
VENYDLHTHSTASDGILTPEELVDEAYHASITTLALTDHDTIAGLLRAKIVATKLGIRFIPGIELSATWNGKNFHIVGLNLNIESPSLQKIITLLGSIREKRAIEISHNLNKHGINHAHEGTLAIAGGGMITRSHFAQFLINEGYARNTRDVFKRFLVHNRPGSVKVTWPDLTHTLKCIKDAGGIGILAHPLSYKLTGNWMRKLLTEFREAGGRGIEVVSGNSTPVNIQLISNYAKKFGLAGSIGSDFHGYNHDQDKMGILNSLPSGIMPVWEIW